MLPTETIGHRCLSVNNKKATPSLRCGAEIIAFFVPCAFSEHCEEILARLKIKYFYRIGTQIPIR